MKWVLINFFLLFFCTCFGQNFNRPVPSGFPNYEFAIEDSSYAGYFTIAVKDGASGSSLKSLALLDHNGYIVWYSSSINRQLDFHFDENFNRFTYSSPPTNGIVNHISLDSTMEVYDTIVAPIPFIGDVHERLLLSNGNTLIIATLDTVVDLSAYIINGQSGSSNTNLACNNILEITPAGNIVFQWNGFDHVSPTEYQDGIGTYSAQFFDYMHANSIDIDFDGHYLLSLRHCSSVLKIDKNSGNVIWRLGGNISDFTLTNDLGFSANHFARSLGNNRYSLFDNGNITSNPKESRAVIFHLDTINMTAEREWEYRHTPAVYAPAQGNYQQFDARHSIINWGMVLRPEPTYTVIDSTDNPVINLYLEDEWTTYRAYLASIPFDFPRPEIACEEQNGVVTLTADASNDYLWSTGETTQTITVLDTGTYMVWTQYGIGMLGSTPFHIHDLSYCSSPLSVGASLQADDDFFIVFDLLGRKVQSPVPGNIYFLRYSSGKVVKLFWTDQMRLEDL